jgi:hypothetical protein
VASAKRDFLMRGFPGNHAAAGNNGATPHAACVYTCIHIFYYLNNIIAQYI